MKEKNKGLIITIIILAIFLFATTGYIIYDKVITKEEVEELKSKVYEKLVELSGELAQLSFQSILNKSPDIVSKQENLKQLFDPFFRIDKSRSRNTGGSGLGLYIAKTVFDYHNIQYKIENTKRGVLFTIILPSNR